MLLAAISLGSEECKIFLFHLFELHLSSTLTTRHPRKLLIRTFGKIPSRFKEHVFLVTTFVTHITPVNGIDGSAALETRYHVDLHNDFAGTFLEDDLALILLQIPHEIDPAPYPTAIHRIDAFKVEDDLLTKFGEQLTQMNFGLGVNRAVVVHMVPSILLDDLNAKIEVIKTTPIFRISTAP